MVMYRDFARRNAVSLGLTGEVANMPDGTVVVTAEGEREKLAAFVEILKKGSLLSDVEKVDVTALEPTGAFNGFSIRYS
jgi:acylphosphatase